MCRSILSRASGLLAVAIITTPSNAQPITRPQAVRARHAHVATTPTSTRVADGRTVFGATAGAVLGGLAGAIIGGWTASNAPPCQIGDPDGCLGATIPRAIWGTGIGITLGTPVGAHLGNHKRGNLLYTTLASTALFAGEVLALRSLIHEGRSDHADAVIGIAIGVPVLQIITTTIVERATAPLAP